MSLKAGINELNIGLSTVNGIAVHKRASRKLQNQRRKSALELAISILAQFPTMGLLDRLRDSGLVSIQLCRNRHMISDSAVSQDLTFSLFF
jgi:hypothetical protein